MAPQKSARTSVVIAVLSLCGMSVSLLQTLVVPLLPDFPRLLGTTADNASWLVTATLLTTAVATPTVAKLADMVGKRLMMLVCLGVMIAGAVTAGLGQSLAPVLVGRSLQGFSAALIPVGISIMRDELPRERIGSAVALMSATLGIGGAIGLPMAGVISEHYDWHTLFWVATAVGVVMFALVATVVPESSVRSRGRFDYLGAVLLSAALTALLLAVSKGGTWGWTSELTIGLLVAGVVVLALWVPYELRVGSPLVDIRTSTRPAVLLTNVASLLLGIAMFANLLLTTQLLQAPVETGFGFGLSVIDAGLVMLPGGLLMVFLAPVSAAISRTFGARTTLIIGAATMSLGYVACVFLVGNMVTLLLGAGLVSTGTAIGYAAMPTLIMKVVPITETASANGLNTLLRLMCTSISSAVVAAILTSTTVRLGPSQVPSVGGFTNSFWFAALAALVAALVAITLPRRSLRSDDEVKSTDEDHETVVRGVVHNADGQPVRDAVIAVLRQDGRQLDWSRVDADGGYSVALPGPGRYVVVTTAEGWAPRSDVLDLPDAGDSIVLTERLSLSGTVGNAGCPQEGALVALVSPSGDETAAVQTGADGRYTLPLPGPGRYVVTAVDPGGSETAARSVTVDGHSLTVDVDLSPERVRA